VTSPIFDSNYKLFKDCYLSTNDVLLMPDTGIVKSRKNLKIDETFLYSSPMDTVSSIDLADKMIDTNQAYVSCRFLSKSDRLKELNVFSNSKNYWFTVGTSDEDFQFIESWCLKNKSKKLNIAVDVAHGDTIHIHQIYEKYSNQKWCANLMSGTVATFSSARNCYEYGCTHIRVGIGPGSACSTRIVTGCGVPNLSAVYNVWLGFQNLMIDDEVVIIADGGIKTSGDIAKYLAAGANAVMVGNLLSKTNESGGWQINKLMQLFNKLSFGYLFKNYIYKQYRGQASYEFQIQRRGSVSGTPEGVQGPIQYPQYTYFNFYQNLQNALKSTLSYVGLNTILDMNPNNIKLIKITENGIKESKPHIL
jgi:IMP dehydrogenase